MTPAPEPGGAPGRFELAAWLSADLRRARSLVHGTAPDTAGGPRLWLGLLSPRFIPVLLCRLAHFFFCLGWGPVAKVFSLLNFFLFGIEIAVRCPIGKGLFFPHTQGTVIGAQSIGDNATIFQGVTLGAREMDFSYDPASRPTVGRDVTLGAGAKVLGGVTLGDGVRVGANAVVLASVEAHQLVVGVPARVVTRAEP